MTSPDGVASGPTDHGKNQAGVHIRARYGVPIVLVGLPFVTAPLLALGAGGAIVFMLAVMAHVVGADWLLIRKPPAELRDFALACLQLAIGAPSALFAIGMTFLIARAGDNSWRAFPFAVTPAVLIWPVLIVVLARGPAESSDV